MTESTWVAWCPKHEAIVGPVPKLQGNSVDILRVPTSCSCPAETLYIVHHTTSVPHLRVRRTVRKERKI